MKNVCFYLIIFLITSNGVFSQTIQKIIPGETKHTRAILPSGNASISIPLFIPPGTNGIVPDPISLNFNTPGGNATLGKGGTLQGISFITRGPRTLAMDGKNRPVQIDAGDVFIDNGNPLVCVFGSNGKDGAEYRTRNETFAKYISYGGVNPSTEQFIKYRSDNQNTIVYYGETEDSKVRSSSSEYVRWGMNRIVDRFGNTVNYKYNKTDSTGELYPIKIEYTANNNVSPPLRPYASIEFDYEDRKDPIHYYVGGFLIKEKKRLKAIRISVEGLLIKTYTITYKYAAESGLSCAVAIQECDSKNNCYGPVKIEWHDDLVDDPRLALDNNKLKPLFSSFINQEVKGLGQIKYDELYNPVFLTGNFRGDGLTGILYLDQKEGKHWFAFPNGDNSFTHKPIVDGIDGVTYAKGDSNSRFLVTDMNADSYSDVLVLDTKGRHWGGKNNCNDGFNLLNPIPGLESLTFTVHAEVFSADVTGDGYGDFLILEPDGNHTIAVSNKTGGYDLIKDIPGLTGKKFYRKDSSEIHIGDFGKDGGIDILHLSYNGDHWICLSNSEQGKISFDFKSEVIGLQKRTFKSTLDGNNLSKRIFSNDFNNDANTDILWLSTDGTPHQIFYSKGDGTFAKQTISNSKIPNVLKTIPRKDSYGRRYLSIDLLNDGSADIISLQSGKTDGGKHYISFSRNAQEFINQPLVMNLTSKKDNGFYSKQEYPIDTWGVGFDDFAYRATQRGWPGLGQDGVQVLQGYFNRDAYPDLICLNTNKQHFLALSAKRNGLIRKVIGSYGDSTKFVYSSLCDSSVYTKDYKAQYPEVDFQAPMVVVSSYTESDGLGGEKKYSYQYGGAVLDLENGGLRGFKQMTVTDHTLGTKTTSWFNTNYKYQSNNLIKQESRLFDGKLISKVKNTLDLLDPFPGKNVFYAYAKSDTTETYELDGSLIQTTTRNREPDPYGNILNEEVQYDKTDGYRNITRKEYEPANEKNWLIRRLKNSTTSYFTPQNKDAVKDEQLFLTDPKTGQISQTTLFPKSDQALVQGFMRNGFGNIIADTLTGFNGLQIEKRISRTEFDAKGRFAIVSTNPLGHRDSATYDNAFGVKISATDPNKQTTKTTLDGFGRPTLTTHPDNTTTTYTYGSCPASSHCPPRAVTWVAEKTTGEPACTTYVDTLGRKIRERCVGFNTGKDILKDYKYDAKDNLVRQSLAYYEGDKDIYWTESKYDTLNRLLLTKNPDSSSTAFEYQGLTTIKTVNGTYTTIVRNLVIGQPEYKVDAKGDTLYYEYDGKGNQTKIKNIDGSTTVSYFNVQNLLYKEEDTHLGTTINAYNAFGEMYRTFNPEDDTITFRHDLLGRVTEEYSRKDGLIRKEYDTQPKGIGKIAKIVGTGRFDREFEYDDLSRLSKEFYRDRITGQLDGFTYDYYEATGQLRQISSLTGHYKKSYHYKNDAYLEKIKDDFVDGKLIWQATDRNASGLIVKQNIGNQLQTRQYNPRNLNLLEISVPNVQKLQYTYDRFKNVRTRKGLVEGGLSVTESFDYDKMNNCTLSRVGAESIQLKFDRNANITSKSDVGDYSYDAPNFPQRLRSAGNLFYNYTESGSRLKSTSDGRQFTYNAYGQPQTISRNDTNVTFRYGADRELESKETYVGGALTTTQLYLGGLIEREITKDTVSEQHFYQAEDELAAFRTTKTGCQDAWYFVLNDHLGSPNVILNDKGSVSQWLSFDPWGKPRKSNWSSGVPPPGLFTDEIQVGFTGHQHTGFDLIHTGPRFYDPHLGRFLCPDPTIPNPLFSPALNRFAYSYNNPLKYTDPSGFTPEENYYIAGGGFYSDFDMNSGFDSDWMGSSSWDFGSSSWGAGTSLYDFNGMGGTFSNMSYSDPFRMGGMSTSFGMDRSTRAEYYLMSAGIGMAKSTLSLLNSVGLIDYNEQTARQLDRYADNAFNSTYGMGPDPTAMLIGEQIDPLMFVPLGRAAKIEKLGAGSTEKLLHEAADYAITSVGKGKGSKYGTLVHSEFSEYIRKNIPDVATEVSYKDGIRVRYGLKGSVRIDALTKEGIYDLKTGNASLTSKRIEQIRQHLPDNIKNLPIKEIKR